MAIFIAAAAFTTASAQSQNKSNTSMQPSWTPSGHAYVEYIYLPDIDTYYYVPRKQFIYQSNGYWTFTSELPKAYRGYDLNGGEKVVINQPGAYRYYAEHRKKYSDKQSVAAVE